MHPLVAFLLCRWRSMRRSASSTALAFVAFGVTRVQPAPMSLGARILILPGAAALWPYVLIRWLQGERTMTRGHRTVHRMLWPALALIVALGFTMALVLPAAARSRPRQAEPRRMSVGFKAVQWNRRKLVYDAILLAGVVLFIGTFMTIGALRNPPADMPAWINLRIKAFGTCAFTMLTIILMIGPLARLDRRFLPLLYNRRHFGVLTFLVALVHAYSVVDWFAVQGAMGDLVSEMTGSPNYGKFIGFPIKALGLTGLIDPVPARRDQPRFLARVPHAARLEGAAHGALSRLRRAGDACGARRDAGGPPRVHSAAARRLVRGRHAAASRRRLARARDRAGHGDWLAVGPPESIPDQCARIVAAPNGERIAVFRDGDQIGALTNVCAHQNGPIGEGRIINGCVTCPWHGYEYRLADGCAPPPFTEKLATYRRAHARRHRRGRSATRCRRARRRRSRCGEWRIANSE